MRLLSVVLVLVLTGGCASSEEHGTVEPTRADTSSPATLSVAGHWDRVRQLLRSAKTGTFESTISDARPVAAQKISGQYDLVTGASVADVATRTASGGQSLETVERTSAGNGLITKSDWSGAWSGCWRPVSPPSFPDNVLTPGGMPVPVALALEAKVRSDARQTGSDAPGVLDAYSALRLLGATTAVLKPLRLPLQRVTIPVTLLLNDDPVVIELTIAGTRLAEGLAADGIQVRKAFETDLRNAKFDLRIANLGQPVHIAPVDPGLILARDASRTTPCPANR